MRAFRLLLLLAALVVMVGCEYWYANDFGMDAVFIETAFSTTPGWLESSDSVYVADGALWLLNEAAWELPYHTGDFALDFEFKFVDPQGGYFGLGILFDCLMEGTYALWLYQSETFGEDRYQLWRYGMASGGLTVAHGPCSDLRIDEPNRVSLVVRDGNILLDVNDRRVAAIDGAQASGAHRLAIRGDKVGIAIDEARLLGPSE